MNIKYFLKLTKKKRKDLVEQTGLSSTSISNYENGINQPTLPVLIKLADFFNISLDTLANRKRKIVDIDSLNENKQKLIDDILNLNSSDTDKVISFIAGMNAKDN